MALAAPVALTKHGRRTLILMSADAYDFLVSGATTPAAGDNTPSSLPPLGRSFLSKLARKASHNDE